MQLTTREKVVLASALEFHLQGISETKAAMESDNATFGDDIESFLDVMGRANEEEAILAEVLKRLKEDATTEDTRGQRATGALRALLSYVQGNARRSTRRRSNVRARR